MLHICELYINLAVWFHAQYITSVCALFTDKLLLSQVQRLPGTPCSEFRTCNSSLRGRMGLLSYLHLADLVIYHLNTSLHCSYSEIV